MERYKVKIYPSAQQDLRDIVDYLNTLSPSAALRYYDKLTEEIASLSTMPERCPRPRDLALAAKGYRYLIVENYLIFMSYPEARCRYGASYTAAEITAHCFEVNLNDPRPPERPAGGCLFYSPFSLNSFVGSTGFNSCPRSPVPPPWPKYCSACRTHPEAGRCPCGQSSSP